MCGEKCSCRKHSHRPVGSPPRVRGKAKTGLIFGQQPGITPACAGKSRSTTCYCSLNGDHPRVCGEKVLFGYCAFYGIGSPPRVRGKAHPALLAVLSTGITPACAGKRHHGDRRGMAVGDHPRVCGEKGVQNDPCFPFLGSPPRVRGKVCGRVTCVQKFGITPACAGKSHSKRAGQQPDGDHPRVCGEKCGCGRSDFVAAGSPPRVRGKDSPDNKNISGRGITPACAGKSDMSFPRRLLLRDHPRVCGEKTKKIP